MSRGVVAVLVTAIALAGCGKRSAPLPPFLRIPAQVTTITATRLGNDVFVSVRIPATNIDASIPIDIDRVEIHAYTGAAPPPPGRFTEFGEVIASIPVFPPPRVDPDDPAPPPPPPVPPTHAAPGATATIRDELTGGALVQGRVDPDLLRPEPAPAADAEPVGPPPPAVLRRFYVAIPINSRGVPGPPSAAAEFPLVAIPDAPRNVRAVYTAAAVTVQWDAPGGLLGFLLDRVIPAEPAPFDLIGPQVGPSPTPFVPPGPTTFTVYREVEPDPLAPRPPAAAASLVWGPEVPAAAGAALPGLTFSDPQMDFGRLRCYRVRAVRGGVLSAASDPYCFSLVDVFPPAAPIGVAAIPSAAGVSLIWDPNREPDLGGYLVLRRDAVDATLRQLTETPIAESRFVDTTAASGTRYIYTVVAVDNRLPLPNVSVESTPIEETAR